MFRVRMAVTLVAAVALLVAACGEETSQVSTGDATAAPGDGDGTSTGSATSGPQDDSDAPSAGDEDSAAVPPTAN